jgi:hypothetical protein
MNILNLLFTHLGSWYRFWIALDLNCSNPSSFGKDNVRNYFIMRFAIYFSADVWPDMIYIYFWHCAISVTDTISAYGSKALVKRSTSPMSISGLKCVRYPRPQKCSMFYCVILAQLKSCQKVDCAHYIGRGENTLWFRDLIQCAHASQRENISHCLRAAQMIQCTHASHRDIVVIVFY